MTVRGPAGRRRREAGAVDGRRYLEGQAARLEPVLEDLLPGGDAPLESAMRYAVLDGGKRLRPVLALAAAAALGVGEPAPEGLVRAAAALEFVHAYSLVHDDLPAMDDAALRRGKPACHRVFGEAVAILAGDALLTLAFDVLASPLPGLLPERQLRAAHLVARAAGHAGMVGGQARDVAGVASDPEAFAAMVRAKTGALFLAAVRLGSILAGAGEGSLDRYGAAFGVAFQIADDLQDGDGFAALLGPEAAARRAREASAEAIAAVEPLGARGRVLAELARFAVERET